eukprot:137500-Rhodomonas_salina.2
MLPAVGLLLVLSGGHAPDLAVHGRLGRLAPEDRESVQDHPLDALRELHHLLCAFFEDLVPVLPTFLPETADQLVPWRVRVFGIGTD